MRPKDMWGEHFWTLGETMRKILRLALENSREENGVFMVDALDTICRETGELGSGGVGKQINNLKQKGFLRELGKVRIAGHTHPVKRLQLVKPTDVSRPVLSLVGPMKLEVIQGGSKYLAVLRPKEQFVVTKQD